MAIIPFGRPDRGMVLFAGLSPASETNVKRVLRLMGVVCLVDFQYLKFAGVMSLM